MGVRVKEAGESECPAVMAGIGAEASSNIAPARKGADFRLVSPRKRICGTLVRRTGK